MTFERGELNLLTGAVMGLPVDCGYALKAAAIGVICEGADDDHGWPVDLCGPRPSDKAVTQVQCRLAFCFEEDQETARRTIERWIDEFLTVLGNVDRDPLEDHGASPCSPPAHHPLVVGGRRRVFLN